LGQLWTSQLSSQSTEDLKAANAVLPSLRFEAAQPHEQQQLPTIVDNELLAGTTVNFPRSLVHLAWILQHAAMWELGSFASRGLPDRPPGFQFVLWDTNARINGLVATDLETLVTEVLAPFLTNAGFANGLFVMTTATDHKNNLNRSVLKKDYARTLRVETIANAAGGTAQEQS